MAAWTGARDRFATAEAIRARGVPATVVASPEDRIDHDPGTSELGLWPTAHHREMGDVRVDGLPVHLSRRPTGASLVARRASGEHNARCCATLLGLPDDEIDDLERDGVV